MRSGETCLSGGLDALANSKKDARPGHEETHSELRLDGPQVLDARAQGENPLAVGKVSVREDRLAEIPLKMQCVCSANTHKSSRHLLNRKVVCVISYLLNSKGVMSSELF